jgi:hypothetical protein
MLATYADDNYPSVARESYWSLSPTSIDKYAEWLQQWRIKVNEKLVVCILLRVLGQVQMVIRPKHVAVTE